MKPLWGSMVQPRAATRCSGTPSVGTQDAIVTELSWCTRQGSHDSLQLLQLSVLRTTGLSSQGIRIIIHGPRSTVREKKGWREWWLGEQVTGVPSLAWVAVSGGGCSAPPH